MKIKIKNKFWRIISWLAMLFVFFLLLIVAFVFSVKVGFFGPIPDYSKLEKIQQNNASRVMSADDKLLGLFYYQNRTNTGIDEIPESFINALIATEDARFYQHKGFDVRSFFRVLVKSILLFDRSSGGGSTLTQQLAKNLFPRKDFSLISLPVAKIKEIFTAIRLEKIYSKEEILELYLNTVPFGENTYGIETASITYFGKKPHELNMQESALLVGLLKANTGYNPRLNKQASRDRRNTVLAQMVKYNYLDQETADSLQSLPVELHFTKLDHVQGPAPYFREFIRNEVDDILDAYNRDYDTNYNLYADGLTIYTTINAKLQSFAEEAVAKQMAYLQKTIAKQWQGREPWKSDQEMARMQIKQSIPFKKMKLRGLTDEEAMDTMRIKHKTRIFTWQGDVDTVISSMDSILYHFGILQCGVLAISGQTGEVLAWVGGANFKYFKYDHVLAARQVGSTIKPLIYATAIENGANPCDYYANDSTSYPEAENWVPKNADNKYGGYYSLQGALVNSVNTVSVKVLMQTGIEETVRSLFEAGITAPLPKVPSLALGSAEIPLYQMVPAYASFINGGRNPGITHIRKIVDRTGNVLYETPEKVKSEKVFSDETIEIMRALLMGVTERGTARALRTSYGLQGDFGGKTGTTQNHTDGWFIGITPEIVIGVWVGGDNPVVHFNNLRNGQGSRTAMPVFARILQQIKSDGETVSFASGSFDVPDEVYDELGCYDFKEDKSVFDFLKKKPEYEDLPKVKSGKSKAKPKDEEPTKVGKFFRRIFGRDDNKKKKKK